MVFHTTSPQRPIQNIHPFRMSFQNQREAQRTQILKSHHTARCRSAIAPPMQGRRGTLQSSMDNFRSGNAKRPGQPGRLAAERVSASAIVAEKVVAAFRIRGVLGGRESPTMSESWVLPWVLPGSRVDEAQPAWETVLAHVVGPWAPR